MAIASIFFEETKIFDDLTEKFESAFSAFLSELVWEDIKSAKKDR